MGQRNYSLDRIFLSTIRFASNTVRDCRYTSSTENLIETELVFPIFYYTIKFISGQLFLGVNCRVSMDFLKQNVDSTLNALYLSFGQSTSLFDIVKNASRHITESILSS